MERSKNFKLCGSAMRRVACAVVFSVSYGWNQDAHYSGAKLAADIMEQGDIDALLQPFGDLTYYISWPDANHRPGSFEGEPDRFGWSMASHFINFPPGQKYDRDAAYKSKTPNAVNSMVFFRQRLLNYKIFHDVEYICPKMKKSDEALYEEAPGFAKPSVLERFKRESTYSISYFLQDVHNPFHCGNADDKGAFDHKVRCEFCKSQKESNIHTVWDADMFDHELRKLFGDKYVDQMASFEIQRYPFQEALYSMVKKRYAHLKSSDPKRVQKWTDDCSGDFDHCIDVAVAETRDYFLDHQDALYAHGGSAVTFDYLDKYLEVAFEQVVKSSVRLAAALTKMASELRAKK